MFGGQLQSERRSVRALIVTAAESWENKQTVQTQSHDSNPATDTSINQLQRSDSEAREGSVTVTGVLKQQEVCVCSLSNPNTVWSCGSDSRLVEDFKAV